jgi:hypothetical protein
MCRKLAYLAPFVLLLGLAYDAAAEIPRDPNLVLYYSYEQVGKIVPDESGKGHNGAVCGDVSLAASGIKWYGAAEFQGTKGPTKYSYLDLNGPGWPAQDIPKSAITISVWVKCKNTGDHHATVNARASDNTWVMHAEIRSGGNYRWLLRAYNSVSIFDIQAGKVTWDEWTHYAGTYDKATGKAILYIDGQVIQQQNIANPPSIAGDWGTGARVGYNVDNARPFTGIMDELYLFTRALSQAEINDLLASDGLPSEKASHPYPANGAELDTTSTLLKWLPGAYAVSNDVYLGTSFEDVNNGTGSTFKGNQADAQYAATDLVWGTTYYWRIDGVDKANPASPWKGDVWSFVLRPPTAWNPTPADGAKWIDPNADLSWSPGRGAAKHFVYFGDSNEAVSKATGAAAQTKTTYDPGTLGFEKVYYWRVDELDDAGALHKGSVWSFTTRRADSGVRGEYYTGDFKTLVLTRVDPGINFNWGVGSPDPKVPVDDFSARWTGEFEVPFTSAWTFTSNCNDWVRLWVNDKLLFDKWGQQSGVEWAATVNLVAGQKYSMVMEYYVNTNPAYAQLYWNSPSSQTPYQPKQVIPQGAFSLPVRARNPAPASGAVDVAQTSILGWTAGEKAAAHDVYFGEDANAVRDATTATKDIYRGRQALNATTFDPGMLEWNKTYYWRIDEVNEASADSPWKGTVWSFTVACFLVVDDMESYNDADNLLYDTWRDNYDPKGDGSGSVVGNDPAPIAEQTIVHGGNQSLPMAYNNAGPKYLFSETVRTFDASQDWTINGVKTLTLFVRGLTTNLAASFYVAVEDKAGKVAVVTNPDAALLTKAEWTEWKIPLTSFTGVNAAAVKKIYLGVGNRAAPKAGGKGKLYLDDIRVVKP